MTRSHVFLRMARISCVGLSFVSIVGCGDSAAPPAVAPPAPTQNAESRPPEPVIATPPAPPTQYKASEDHTAKGMKAAEIGKGIVSTPAKVYLRIPDKLVFDQVKQALDLYRASNGDFPKTQEEFMREIITANNLKLPELPAGSSYVYQPAEGELMIEEPAKP
jgi:hypothetical protein